MLYFYSNQCKIFKSGKKLEKRYRKRIQEDFHMKILNLLVISLMMTSCASSHLMGGIYSSTKANVTTTLARGKVTKTGEACTTSYLSAVALGDASIETARKNGGINKIAYIDSSFTNILGVYQKYCTLVRGN